MYKLTALFTSTENLFDLQMQLKMEWYPLNTPLPQIEQKFCKCLMEHMLQHYFNDRQELASALNLKPTEMDEMHPSDLAARIFKYCAVNRISLDSVIMQMAK